MASAPTMPKRAAFWWALNHNDEEKSSWNNLKAHSAESDRHDSRNRIGFAAHGEEQPHCFVAAERTKPIAKEAFDRLTAFLKEEDN